MSEKDYKYKVIRELQFVSEDNSFSDAERDYARKLGNNLVDKGEAEVKKILYASFNDPQLYNVTKAVASALKEDTEIGKVTKATTKAPVYNTKVGEMFAKFGGDEILDERSPKYWAKADSEVDDSVISDIADEYGMPKQDLYKMLQDESIKERNRQIFSGTDLGSGWGDRLAALGLKFVAPRTMESLEQGKGFVPADVAADVAENIVFGVNPIGKAGQLGVRAFGKYSPRLATEGAKSVARAGVGVAEAFGTPAIVKVAYNIVQESIDGERVKSSAEIADESLTEGGANLLMGRYGLRNIGKFADKERSTIRKILTGKESKPKTEEVQKTWKEFKGETEKALKEREKVAKGVGGTESKMAMSPKQRNLLEGTNPIFSGDEELDNAATEIAKIVGGKGVSLDKATQLYFEKLAKKRGDAFVGQQIERFNDRKNPVFVVGEGGKVYPQTELLKLIEQSSWGDVLTQEFAKTKRTRPQRESFIRKQLTRDVGIDGRPYGKFKIASQFQESLPTITPFGVEDERKKREERKNEEAEKKARSRYVFNPYKTEEKKEKPRGIRAYLRGEAERPTQEEVERAIARKLGIDLGE
jgi:hypothetical protein